MQKATLVCDIGNTNISVGLFRGRRFLLNEKLPTKEASHFNLFLKKRLATKKIDLSGIEAVVICSVVPKACKALKKSLLRLRRLPIYVAGEDFSVPIKNLYLKPLQVGQDRLINSYAGVSLYGAPLVIVDFGTAVTFNVISKRKEYLGGMILPGLQVSLDVLRQRTALLPRVSLARPKGLIGRDTSNSILSGIVYGFACLCDCLSAMIKEKIGKSARVILTGGDAGLISKYCKKIDILDTDLILKGLRLLRIKPTKKSSVIK